jgi:hypothetical protein
LLEDAGLARRLWDVSEDIVARHGASLPKSLREAA